MSDELYRAVLASPDRDGPRRRYADAIGDELGEFIRLSLDVDRRRGAPAAHDRALRLRRQLQPQLAAPLAPWIRGCMLDRGLVAEVDMDARTFIEHGAQVFARAPIQHVNLVDAKPVFAELVHCPLLARVQTLGLAKNALGDHEVALLANCPAVRALRFLGLADNQIGRAGLEAIAASEHLRGVQLLYLSGNLVESPVLTYTSDWVGGWNYPDATPASRQGLEARAWMDPGPNPPDRFRLCDAGE